MTIQELAAGIAADIRRQGHFQSKPGQRMYLPYDAEDAPCCLVQSPTTYAHHGSWAIQLADAIETDGVHDIAAWNDRTPTEEVLAKLDEIAAA